MLSTSCICPNPYICDSDDGGDGDDGDDDGDEDDDDEEDDDDDDAKVTHMFWVDTTN